MNQTITTTETYPVIFTEANTNITADVKLLYLPPLSK